MTGNYECAYALGILNAQLGLPEITEYEDIAALKEQLLEKAADYKTEDAGCFFLPGIFADTHSFPIHSAQIQGFFPVPFDKNLHSGCSLPKVRCPCPAGGFLNRKAADLFSVY